MKEMVQQIIDTEWNMFDDVHNIGGRADCQDDQRTFTIMRASQLENWSEEMLASYAGDLVNAQLEGRNPLAEKYGYMMRWTHPDEFRKIEDQLPPVSDEKEAMIRQICDQQVEWQEETAREFPKLAGHGRVIHQSEEKWGATSFETYMLGELSTYSETTLRFYLEWIRKLKSEGRNMNREILLYTVKEYGYQSLQDAEKKL